MIFTNSVELQLMFRLAKDFVYFSHRVVLRIPSRMSPGIINSDPNAALMLSAANVVGSVCSIRQTTWQTFGYNFFSVFRTCDVQHRLLQQDVTDDRQISFEAEV
jgi:hypothetical protein